MPLAIFDAIEYISIHERLTQADQHHVFAAVRRALDQPLKDVAGHVLLGLFVRFARAHGAVKIALRGGFDDVFDGQGRHTFALQEVAPQKPRAVEKTHAEPSSHVILKG